MNVFLSSIACHPELGSEPGVGWRWVNGLAGRVGLTVLTRSIHREAIEAHRSGLDPAAALQRVRFEYFDLPRPWLEAERRGWLPYGVYYVLWQWLAARWKGSLADGHDVVHHLTLCTILLPGFWKLRKASYVIGPVGAPEVDGRYLPLFGRSAGLQAVRGWVVSRCMRLPWISRMTSKASAVVPANSATRDFLEKRGVRTREVMLDTGAPDVPAPGGPRRAGKGGGCEFIFAGRLERRKGLELSLRAFARAAEDPGFTGSFTILGNGPDRLRLEALTGALGIAGRVRFAGALPRAEVLERFAGADVFVFTSVRDTSAGVNLEAMACGLPVVCLAHQGVADITTDACALRVRPGSIDETVTALAEALRRVAADEGLRAAMGREARRRATEDFSWEEKFSTMVRYYEEAVKTSR